MNAQSEQIRKLLLQAIEQMGRTDPQTRHKVYLSAQRSLARLSGPGNGGGGSPVTKETLHKAIASIEEEYARVEVPGEEAPPVFQKGEVRPPDMAPNGRMTDRRQAHPAGGPEYVGDIRDHDHMPPRDRLAFLSRLLDTDRPDWLLPLILGIAIVTLGVMFFGWLFL